MSHQTILKILKSFLIITLFLVLLTPFLTVHASVYDTIKFKPNVTIPGANSEFKAGAETPMETTGEGGNLLMIRYIVALYKFFVGIAGIIAVFMIVFGGVLWLFSGGSSESISKAKEIIVGSITGLLLAVGSYLILFTVNPGLVGFSISISPVAVITGEERLCNKTVFDKVKAPYGMCGDSFQISLNQELIQAGQVPCTFIQCDNREICSKGFLYRCEKKVANIFSFEGDHSNLNTKEWITYGSLDSGVATGYNTNPMSCGEALFNTFTGNYILGTDCSDVSKQDKEKHLTYCFIDLTKKVTEYREIKKNGNAVTINVPTARCALIKKAVCSPSENSAAGCSELQDIISNNIIITGNQVVAKLQPAAAAVVASFADAWVDHSSNPDPIHCKIGLNDAFRSWEKQEQYRCENSSGANSSATSPHVKGLAIDISLSDSCVDQTNFEDFVDLALEFDLINEARRTGHTFGYFEDHHFTYCLAGNCSSAFAAWSQGNYEIICPNSSNPFLQ